MLLKGTRNRAIAVDVCDAGLQTRREVVLERAFRTVRNSRNFFALWAAAGDRLSYGTWSPITQFTKSAKDDTDELS